MKIWDGTIRFSIQELPPENNYTRCCYSKFPRPGWFWNQFAFWLCRQKARKAYSK